MTGKAQGLLWETVKTGGWDDVMVLYNSISPAWSCGLFGDL